MHNRAHSPPRLSIQLSQRVVERDRRRGGAGSGVVLPQKCVLHILPAVTPPRTESEASEQKC